MICPNQGDTCPDSEACMTGTPCSLVRRTQAEAEAGKMTSHQGMELELSQWWQNVTQIEIAAVVPKAVEYGPNSMIEVGRAMGRMSGRDLTDQDAIEIACMFYICGKLGRWVDAVAHGDRPSDDTIHDIGIYIKMAQRNRDVGGWPFNPKEKRA